MEDKSELYGYARVSSREQRLDRQLAALAARGVSQANIFTDKLSGRDFDRPGWRRLLRRLKPGDTLAIASIDRLGRNYAEILEQWRRLTQIRGVALAVLDMPILDSRRPHDLTQKLIADIVLQLLSYVAEMERRMMRSRQAEGIAAARQRGVKFGAPRKAVPAEFAKVCAAWRSGEISERKAARRLRVSRDLFRRWTQECTK